MTVSNNNINSIQIEKNKRTLFWHWICTPWTNVERNRFMDIHIKQANDELTNKRTKRKKYTKKKKKIGILLTLENNHGATNITSSHGNGRQCRDKKKTNKNEQILQFIPVLNIEHGTRITPKPISENKGRKERDFNIQQYARLSFFNRKLPNYCQPNTMFMPFVGPRNKIRKKYWLEKWCGRNVCGKRFFYAKSSQLVYNVSYTSRECKINNLFASTMR